jgi:HD-like signal output (HDOD) protein
MLKIFKKNKTGHKEELQKLLSGYEVPSFSSTVMGVLSILRDPESSMTEIAEQIEVDPGMHVKVLKTVNSAAFGLSAKVVNVPHAITLLGRSRLESLVLSIVVHEALPSAEARFLDLNQFWLAASRRASLARTLASHLHPTTQSESFSVGLLQDMAVPVIASVKKDEYRSVYEEWQSSPETRLDVLEKDAFGYDHPTIGALIIEEWGLPKYLAKMVSEHHHGDGNPEVEPALRIASHIRDSDESDGTDAIIEVCRESFHLEPDVTKGMIEKAFEDAMEFYQALN